MRQRVRNRRNITVYFFCHLFLLACVITSAPAQTAPTQQLPALSASDEGEPVTITSDQQEKDGNTYKMHGNAEIEFRDLKFHADDIVYDRNTGQATATGHLTLEGGPHDENVQAERGEYNVRTRKGKFYTVTGTTGLRFRGKNVSLTTDQPFIFTGESVEVQGNDRIIVVNGTVTSCRLPDPKWTFHAGKVVIDLGKTAHIYHSTFRIKNIPILYFPYAAHPVTKLARQSGFLVPNVGASSRKGFILGDSFYWAINRSMDATVGAEYFSSRGFAQHGQFRAKPSDNSFIDFTYFGVLDRGFGPLKIDQGGEDAKLSAAADMPHGIRGVVDAEYLSRFLFRLAWEEQFSQAVNSEVKSRAFLTKSYQGVFFSASANRYQNYQSVAQGDVVTIVRVPSFEINSVDKRIGPSPLYWSVNAAAEGISRREPSFKTADLVGRFDLNPHLALPLFLRGWTFRPEIGARTTYYTQRNSSTSGVPAPIDQALNRRALEVNVDLRPPTVGRIFEKPFFGRTVKHSIEPHFTYRLVNGVDSFNNVLRFDERDILSDTSEMEYGLTQRLFLKRKDAKPCDPAPDKKCDNGPQEFVSWEVVQRYYFDPDFGGALVTGKRNVLTSTEQLTGLAFLTSPRNYSPVISKLRVRATSDTDVSWQLDYDTKIGKVNGSTVFVNHRIGDFFIGGSHAFMLNPGETLVTSAVPSPFQFNQFRVLAGYGGPNHRGLSSAIAIGFDDTREFLQYASFQNSYNWDCCGLSMEYRRFALGTVRNENQFRFAFTLANIGTFGNLKRQEKLF
jgi:LPS-assembly protein